jgi:hypothetical protein
MREWREGKVEQGEGGRGGGGDRGWGWGDEGEDVQKGREVRG